MIPFNTIKTIGIIRRNGFGDILCSIPLVLRCKEIMPEAKITLFIEKKSASLIPYLHGPDRIISISSHGNKYYEMIKLAWQERFTTFDLVLSAKTTPMKLMNLSLFALRARCRAAYVNKSWHDSLINYPTPYINQPPVHQALQLIHLIDPEFKNLPTRLYPKLSNAKNHRPFTQKTLLISVSNNRAGSMLSFDRTAQVLNIISKRHSFGVAISCLTKDIANAQAIASLLTMDHQIISTEKFDDFITLLNSVDAIFSGDGGIVHLTAALQKPGLFLFGGTKTWQWGPLNDKASTLFHPQHVMNIPIQDILQGLEKMMMSL
jgi:ADP-heptose:LPS heptosyltransferase